MSDDAPQVPDTLTGRCMCGAVTYKITENPMVDAFATATAAGRNLGAPSQPSSSSTAAR